MDTNPNDLSETKEFLAILETFVVQQTQNIIALLQEGRFANDGNFNGHEPWAPNVRPDIVAEKSGKPPLQDTGELKRELTDPDNWDLDPQWSGSTLTLNIPDEEEFTDPKYDALENDSGGEYYGTKTGKLIKFKSKPPRKFKDISYQDAEWVAENLEEAIRGEFGK